MLVIMALQAGESGTILSGIYDALLKDFFAGFMDQFFIYGSIVLGAVLTVSLMPRIIYEVGMLLDFFMNSSYDDPDDWDAYD